MPSLFSPLALAGQALAYAAIAALIGYLSTAPDFVRFPEDMAQIKVSFAHGAKPKGGCRRRTAEEIAALPPNMRRPLDCPRERLPIAVEIEIDGKMVISEMLPPTGLNDDGPARIYRKITIPPGRHRVVARLRDSDRAEGFDYVRDSVIDVEAGHNIVVDFKADLGGFLFM